MPPPAARVHRPAATSESGRPAPQVRGRWEVDRGRRPPLTPSLPGAECLCRPVPAAGCRLARLSPSRVFGPAHPPRLHHWLCAPPGWEDSVQPVPWETRSTRTALVTVSLAGQLPGGGELARFSPVPPPGACTPSFHPRSAEINPIQASFWGGGTTLVPHSLMASRDGQSHPSCSWRIGRGAQQESPGATTARNPQPSPLCPRSTISM